MTAIVTADLHLSANPRDAYRFSAMEKIGALIEEHKAETLLVLGDLTEEKDFHPASLVNDVVDMIDAFSEMCEVVILRGNHDYTRADCPFFHFLRRLKNVRWVNEADAFDVGGLGVCHFLPHTNDFEKDWSVAALELYANPVWTFAHNSFAGASSEHGHKLSGIPTSVFPKGTRVISGDIHTPQTLGPVTYVGSPYRVDFGDDFEPRVLRLTGTDMRSISLPGPQKRLIELAKGFKLKDIRVNEGDIVKVRYTLSPAERDKWNQIKADLRTFFTGLGCNVYVIQPVLEKVTGPRVIAPSIRKKSDETLVREFAKQAGFSETMLVEGMGLLTEV